MTNNEFREKLIKKLQDRLPDLVIQAQDVRKNNGVVFLGICISNKDINMAPTIYTEGLFYDYEKGCKDMDGAVDSVLEMYENFKPAHDFDLSTFTDYGKVRHKLQGKLVSTERNIELLKDVPHRDFFDLSLMYIADVAHDEDNGRASIRITNSHMKSWGVTEEDLYAQF